MLRNVLYANEPLGGTTASCGLQSLGPHNVRISNNCTTRLGPKYFNKKLPLQCSKCIAVFVLFSLIKLDMIDQPIFKVSKCLVK